MSNISVTTHGVLVTGLEGRIVPIKVEYEPGGLPALDIHGGKEANARDARVRVRSALDSIKHPLAGRAKVVIPDDADAGLDLPIALACLIAMGVVPNPSHGVVAFGEVSLMGAIRPVRGAFNRLEAIQAKGHYALLPKASAHEAWDGPPFHAAADLAEALYILAEPAPSWPEDRRSTHGRPTDQHDFSQVHPRNPARRGLEIAAVGGHNVLMTGQPGTGGARSPASSPSQASTRTTARSASAPSGPPTTPSARRASSAADTPRAPVRSPSPTTASSCSTRRPSSGAPASTGSSPPSASDTPTSPGPAPS